MKMLVLPLVALLTCAAATATFIAVGHPGSGTAAVVQTPQEVTLKVVSDDDQLVGTNLVVRPGLVVLRIVNYARHAHTFSVPGLGIERVILPGSPTAPTTTVVRFRTPRGVFAWYCRLPCGNAMTGHIYVSDQHPRLRGPLWSES
jgi:plastocyanin